MSKPSHKMTPKIKRYFRCLWAALRGRCLSAIESRDLQGSVQEATAKLGQMHELYYTLVEKWKETSEAVRQYERLVAKLQGDIASYQKLIETLRTSVSDKDHELARMRQQYLEALDKQGGGGAG